MKKGIILILLCLSFVCFPCFASNKSCPTPIFTKSASADLNGDGQLDKISLSEISDAGNFLIKVNEALVRDKFEVEEAADGFIIVDLDKNDKYQEVAVHTPGPSSDDEYLIYGYDGKNIKRMGRLKRWPKFWGNGEVMVSDWMGFWIKKDKYVLDQKSRNLKCISQDLYYVGQKAVAINNFPIFQTRKSKQIVSEITAGTEIIILLCDPSPSGKNPAEDFFLDWYLIKSKDGLLGWARLNSFQDKVKGLPWAD